MEAEYQADLDRVARMPAVPTILDIVCRATGMRFAAVARVTEDRWIACSVLDRIDFGLKPGGELKVQTTICHEIRQSGHPVMIDDVPADARYAGHPTPAMYGFRSYISVPIVLNDGSFFGTLCAIDPNPARVDIDEVASMFRLFAELIASHLDADRALVASQSDLVAERSTSELREQFLAVLGHDLRNLSVAQLSGAKLLERMPLEQRAATIAGLMRDGAQRMSALIDNVVDLARGRLGGGLVINVREGQNLEPVLTEIVAGLAEAHPDREIMTTLALAAPVACDPERIGQLLSNLLENALTYGDESAPVRVMAWSTPEGMGLSVANANAGEPIPLETLERIFEPYYRGRGRSNRQGLGLGLYIASEIARAHGGTLIATSIPEETRFVLHMP